MPEYKFMLVTAVTGALLAAPTLAADICGQVLTTMGDQNPEQFSQTLEQQAQADTGASNNYWAAASVLRCTAAMAGDPVQKCLRAGHAKALYDKFDDTANSQGKSKLWKMELADAKKSSAALVAEHAVSCVQLGKQQAQNGQHGQAANLYEAAYMLVPKPVLLYNAARACELGNLWQEAAVFYTAYMALPGPWRDRRDAVNKLVGIQRRLASDTGDLVKNAQVAAETAKQTAARAEAAAGQAQHQARTADQRAQGAEQRAALAEQRAQQAELLAKQADSRAQQAEAKAKQAEATAADAQRKAQLAEQRAADAQMRAVQANQRAEAIEAKLREMSEAQPQYPRR